MAYPIKKGGKVVGFRYRGKGKGMGKAERATRPSKRVIVKRDVALSPILHEIPFPHKGDIISLVPEGYDPSRHAFRVKTANVIEQFGNIARFKRDDDGSPKWGFTTFDQKTGYWIHNWEHRKEAYADINFSKYRQPKIDKATVYFPKMRRYANEIVPKGDREVKVVQTYDYSVPAGDYEYILFEIRVLDTDGYLTSLYEMARKTPSSKKFKRISMSGSPKISHYSNPLEHDKESGASSIRAIFHRRIIKLHKVR